MSLDREEVIIYELSLAFIVIQQLQTDTRSIKVSLASNNNIMAAVMAEMQVRLRTWLK